MFLSFSIINNHFFLKTLKILKKDNWCEWIIDKYFINNKSSDVYFTWTFIALSLLKIAQENTESYCTVLYYPVLYRTVLCSSVLYSIVLSCTVPYYHVLYCSLCMYFKLLYCTVHLCTLMHTPLIWIHPDNVLNYT